MTSQDSSTVSSEEILYLAQSGLRFLQVHTNVLFHLIWYLVRFQVILGSVVDEFEMLHLGWELILALLDGWPCQARRS